MRCHKPFHGNAVKGFWALWGNVYDHVCLLLSIFPSLLKDNFTSKKTRPMYLYVPNALFSILHALLNLMIIHCKQKYIAIKLINSSETTLNKR
jgi:hypothetical protein